ncbi:uncharacterized protein RJT21DRAFT_3225 [Scheffersomyces amazonensis]|uniref:uncharacterized protein n=1 Tax=Scheffersomyces amazonensis TaxID=1078765 RepID=UPI00315C8A9B
MIQVRSSVRLSSVRLSSVRLSSVRLSSVRSYGVRIPWKVRPGIGIGIGTGIGKGISRFSTIPTSLPPRKSYQANTTGLSLLWNKIIPINVKYFTGIGLFAFSLIHIHPNVLVTVVPPILVGGYFGYRKYIRWIHKISSEKLLKTYSKNSKDDKIQIKKYDESELSNVLKGIENEFDSFKVQLVDIIERRLLDQIIKSRDPQLTRLFIEQSQESEQVSININANDVETWITSKVNVPGEDDLSDISILSNFFKFSLPFYSSKDINHRKRLGVIQVYLVEVPTDDDSLIYNEYQIGIEVTPYSWLTSSKSIFITSIEGEGITKSKILIDSKSTSKNKTESEDEEIIL